MERTNQTVQHEIDENNRGTFRGQTVKVFHVDSENYAYGTWKGKMVASFHIDNGEWYTMPVSI